jgi:hypothetical protein
MLYTPDRDFTRFPGPQTEHSIGVNIRHQPYDFLVKPVFLYLEGQTGTEGETIMAKIIEFYIPKNFRKDERRSAQDERGRVIEFAVPKKSA